MLDYIPRTRRRILHIITVLLLAPLALTAQMQPVGPGEGSFDGTHIDGQFAEWDRESTPMLVLRVHGVGRLQTFAEISLDGEFRIALPEIPSKGNYGSKGCGDPAKGRLVQVSDFSLLTTLPGFTSPSRWDRGMSEIGIAMFCDAQFSENIGKEGTRRAYWLYSPGARTVEAGECNNVNSFPVEEGWNAFTLE